MWLILFASIYWRMPKTRLPENSSKRLGTTIIQLVFKLLKICTANVYLCFYFLDSRIPAILLALHTVLIPVKVGSGFKPTIATAQADTVLFCENLDEARNTYNNLTAEETINSPRFAVLAKDFSTPCTGCLVLYKNLEYRLPTVTRGVDVFIKCLHVLGLPVSKISKLVWIFVSQHFYGIRSSNTYVNIVKLQQYLGKTKECLSTAT